MLDLKYFHELLRAELSDSQRPAIAPSRHEGQVLH